jgi:hypothetical protein
LEQGGGVWFEHHGVAFEQGGGVRSEAIAGASMEKEAISGTAKAPPAATAFSRVRLLGGRRSRSELSVLTQITPLATAPA